MLRVLLLIASILALTACQSNTVSYQQKPDGTVSIVDSVEFDDNLKERLKYFRTEGRNVARICVQYDGNLTGLASKLTAIGYTVGRDIPGKKWHKKSKYNVFPTPYMWQDEPCVLRTFGSNGKLVYQGASAALQELGYTQVDARNWRKGSEMVELTGVVTSAGSSTNSSVKILRK